MKLTVIRKTNDVFPTPSSPTITTLNGILYDMEKQGDDPCLSKLRRQAISRQYELTQIRQWKCLHPKDRLPC